MADRLALALKAALREDSADKVAAAIEKCSSIGAKSEGSIF